MASYGDVLAAVGAFRNELEQQAQCLVGDAVFRIVEEEAGCLGGQPLTARRVGGEQRPQVHVAHCPGVRLERIRPR